MPEWDLRKLIDYLNYCTRKYDKGIPTISDEEWDNLYFKLEQMEKDTGIIYPDSPTQKIYFKTVSELPEVTHNHLMLSLDKTKDIERIKNFQNGKSVIYMLKMDGLTLSLRYINGKLVSAETRGNGISGEDVTHNIKLVKNVPQQIPIKDEVVVDGEIICDIKTFEEKFSQSYKNPRNYAAGAIRRLNSEENADCGLSFIAWDCIKGFTHKTLSAKLYEMKDMGFTTVPFLIEHETVESDIEYLQARAAEMFYPIDGIVIKYDDVDYYNSLGNTEHHFRGGIAYKFYDEEYETTLKYIDYDISRKGILTPVAVFEPIDIDGSVVSRASLHNVSVMRETLGEYPYFGQKIKVAKMNMIIPQITSAEKRSYEEIIKANGAIVDGADDLVCPCCGTPAKLMKSDTGIEYFYCPNEQCEGKLAQQIDHFLGKKGLDVKGISRATIEKLIDWGWVGSIEDIFTLRQYEIGWRERPGFGKASVSKILDAIDEGRKNVNLASFISGLGIPLVGKTIGKELEKIFGTYQEFRDFVDTDDSYFWEFDGMGEEIDRALKEFDYTEADKIVEKYITFKDMTKEENNAGTDLTGVVFCVTGKLTSGQWKNRDELSDYITDRGGKVVSSMSSKVNYLINNDATSGSAKNVAAKKAGIPIITEAEFIAKFGQTC